METELTVLIEIRELIRLGIQLFSGAFLCLLVVLVWPKRG